MTRKILKFLPVLAVLLAACGDNPVGLEACRAFPPVTLSIGQIETVTPCFASTATVTYQAKSSNPEVATAAVRGNDVLIQAHSPGGAVITITGSNEDGQGEVMIDVSVLNRDPEVVGSLDAVRMLVGWMVHRNLAGVFEDPEDQDLTYEAQSSWPGVVRASVSGDTLTLNGLDEGDAEIVVTASDGYATASVSMAVTVLAPEAVYEDQFDGGLGHWCKETRGPGPCLFEEDNPPGLRVRGGNLETWGVNDDVSVAVRETRAADFAIATRIRAGGDSTAVVLGALLDHETYWYFELSIQTFTDDDFSVGIWNGDFNVQEWIPLGSGNFGLSSFDQYVDVRFWYANNQYHLSFNGGETFSYGDASNTSNRINKIVFKADHYGTEIGEAYRIRMDRIGVYGLEPAGRVAAESAVGQEAAMRSLSTLSASSRKPSPPKRHLNRCC